MARLRVALYLCDLLGGQVLLTSSPCVLDCGLDGRDGRPGWRMWLQLLGFQRWLSRRPR
ncbi:MAG: hypothetical protein ISS56_21310 [Anaerolineae bacterium]|nr:hypothetical protein [Anaerolineae bacterium]